MSQPDDARGCLERALTAGLVLELCVLGGLCVIVIAELGVGTALYLLTRWPC